MTTCFASIGLALILAMQDPTVERATETSVPAVNVVNPDAADDEDPDRRSRAGRNRRSAADDRPRIRESDTDAADEPPRIRDEDGGERPPRRRRFDSDAAKDRPKPKDSDDQPERVTVIMRLKHVPAKDVATTLAEWLDLESEATEQNAPTVVAVIITNSLMVTGEPRQVREINRILRELDQAPAQIQIKALLVQLSLPDDAADFNEIGPFKGDISEIVAEMKERGELRVLAQSELLAGDNQPAFVMVGNRVPRISGSSVTSRGRTNRVDLENVGTTLGVTGRVADDQRVTLEIDIERSHLGPEREGTPVASGGDGDVTRIQRVETLTVQTTATLRSGETAVLGGLIYKDDTGRGQVLMLVQPSIIKP